jgi:hypothetical protein
MLALAFGVVMTSAIVVKIWAMAGRHAADMGSVSHQWVAAHNAAQPASYQ